MKIPLFQLRCLVCTTAAQSWLRGILNPQDHYFQDVDWSAQQQSGHCEEALLNSQGGDLLAQEQSSCVEVESPFWRALLNYALQDALSNVRIILSLLAEKRSVAKQAHLGSAGKGYLSRACIIYHVKKLSVTSQVILPKPQERRVSLLNQRDVRYQLLDKMHSVRKALDLSR
jgi:hypothetical protein